MITTKAGTNQFAQIASDLSSIIAGTQGAVLEAGIPLDAEVACVEGTDYCFFGNSDISLGKFLRKVNLANPTEIVDYPLIYWCKKVRVTKLVNIGFTHGFQTWADNKYHVQFFDTTLPGANIVLDNYDSGHLASDSQFDEYHPYLYLLQRNQYLTRYKYADGLKGAYTISGLPSGSAMQHLELIKEANFAITTADVGNNDGNLTGAGTSILTIFRINPNPGAVALSHTNYFYYSILGINQQWFGSTYYIPKTKHIIITMLASTKIIIVTEDYLCPDNCASCPNLHSDDTCTTCATNYTPISPLIPPF